MLNNIRCNIGLFFVGLAKRFIVKSGHKNILRAIRCLELAVMIVPPSEEIHNLCVEFGKMTEQYFSKTES